MLLSSLAHLVLQTGCSDVCNCPNCAVRYNLARTPLSRKCRRLHITISFTIDSFVVDGSYFDTFIFVLDYLIEVHYDYCVLFMIFTIEQFSFYLNLLSLWDFINPVLKTVVAAFLCDLRLIGDEIYFYFEKCPTIGVLVYYLTTKK